MTQQSPPQVQDSTISIFIFWEGDGGEPQSS